MAAAKDENIEIWSNLLICGVEEWGTILVRESPHMGSETSRQFLKFEESINKKFSKRLRYQEFANTVVPDIGESIMVFHNNYWYRGIIHERFAKSGTTYATVYLIDYGEYIDARAAMMIHLPDNPYSCVPHQAKRITLDGVIPVSLNYTLHMCDLKLKPCPSRTWDKAAIKFLRSLKDCSPLSEFHCLSISDNEDIYSGYLHIEMNSAVVNLICEHIKDYKPRGTTESLGNILVNCGYAVHKLDLGKTAHEGKVLFDFNLPHFY